MEWALKHIFRVPFCHTKIKEQYLSRAGRQVSCSGGSTRLPAIPNMAALFHAHHDSSKLSQVIGCDSAFLCLPASPAHAHSLTRSLAHSLAHTPLLLQESCHPLAK